MTRNHQAGLVTKLEPEAGLKLLLFAKNNDLIMGTVLPCNRLADTFDVDMPSCIMAATCSSFG